MKRFARLMCILLVAILAVLVLMGCKKKKGQNEGNGPAQGQAVTEEIVDVPTMDVQDETEIEVETGDGIVTDGF